MYYNKIYYMNKGERPMPKTFYIFVNIDTHYNNSKRKCVNISIDSVNLLKIKLNV